MRIQASEIKKGDLIRVTTTVKVDHDFDPDRQYHGFGHRIDSTDVKSGHRMMILDGLGSARFELLHRPVQNNFKPGDEVTGNDVFETPWRRGTVLRNQRGTYLVLDADGYWTGTRRAGQFTFENFQTSGSVYTVVSLGEKVS